MKKIYLALALGAACYSVGFYFWASSKKYKANMGFESGDLSGWSLGRLAEEGAAVVITKPVRAGSYAAAVTLAPGRGYKDSWKSELSDDFWAPFGGEIWYRVSHFVPEDFTMDEDDSCVLAQWHNVSPQGTPGGRPPLAHRYRNGRLDITVDYSLTPIMSPKDSTTVTIHTVPDFQKGKWHDFVYRVIFSATDKGEVDAWYDGKRVASYRGPIGYPVDEWGPYFKTGVYCRKSPKKPLTAYVDEYRRGKTRGEVLLQGEALE